MATSKTSAEFILDLSSAFEEAVEKEIVTVTRMMGLEALSRIVMKSPVDTGRFRANWNVSFGTQNTATTEDKDKPGTDTIARGRAVINGIQTPVIVWVSNSLPYANALENGHSKQAPLGMVAVTFSELSATVRV